MAAVTPLSPSSLSNASSPSAAAAPFPPSTPSRRVTQRAPQSCVFCTRRKLRCSKIIPCTNCTERGHASQCHREAVVLSRLSTSGGRQPAARRRVRQASSVGLSVDSPVSSSVEICIEQSLSTMDGSPSITGPVSTPNGDPVISQPSPIQTVEIVPEHDGSINLEQSAQPEAMTNSPHGTTDVDQTDLAVEAAMSLECLAWGAHHQEKHLRTTYRQDHIHAERLDSGYSGSDEDSNAGQTRQVPRRPITLATPPIRSLLDELDLLLTPQQTRAIILFHQRHVAWMHNVVYMPFFVRDCEDVRQTGSALQQDPAWVSLYCAVLCTGVYYMSGREHRQLGLDEGYSVAKALYRLTVEVINASDFMLVQSIYSLQAICVLVLAAHAFGDTRRMKVLLACANSMGQGLGHRLHLLGSPSDNDTSTSTTTFIESVDLQIRQRIWCFLCTQDWYLIASKKAYSIVPEHNTTPVPANCREDFDDIVTAVPSKAPMQDCPLSVQTQSTYMIFLFRLTSIYRSLFDELRAVQANAGTDSNNSPNAVSACFDHVLAADRRLEAAMGEIDEFSRGGAPSSAQWRALVITSWHQRVMIHRTFFCRSFQDKRYHYSRFVCLAAARKILRSYLDTTTVTSLVAPDAGASAADIEIWSIPTHAISGCIILTLHALFTAEKYTLEKSDVDLVHGCLAVLRARPRPNSIVDRGIRIIQHLLHTTNTSTSNSPRRNYRRLDPHEISQLARDIDMDDGEVGTNARAEGGARPGAVPAPMVSTATTRSQYAHSQPDFAQALLNSQLDAFQSRTNGSVGGDDELFMPWWFDSMLNGYGI